MSALGLLALARLVLGTTAAGGSMSTGLAGVSTRWAAPTYTERRAGGRSVIRGLSIGTRDEDFDRFFLEHYEPMVKSLTAAFGHAERADEAVQDAFMKAYVRWGRVHRLDAPHAWVRRVAINRLRDLHRAAGRRERAEQRAGIEQTVVAEVRDAGLRSGELVALLEGLPERQRTAMALFYVEDLSVRDVAASMKISQGAVKAHLSQGRASIAAKLDTDAHKTGTDHA